VVLIFGGVVVLLMLVAAFRLFTHVGEPTDPEPASLGLLGVLNPFSAERHMCATSFSPSECIARVEAALAHGDFSGRSSAEGFFVGRGHS
jgi:hypothetical protein